MKWSDVYKLKYGVRDLKSLTPDDISKMRREQLIAAVRAAQKTVNPRYENLLKMGGSFASDILSKEGKISLSGITKDINKMRHELNRAVSFLRSTTSTVKGFRTYIAEVDARIASGDKSLSGVYESLSKEERKEFWDAYHSIESSHHYTSMMGKELGSGDLQTLTMLLYIENRHIDFVSKFRDLREVADREKTDLLELVKGESVLHVEVSS